jgi:hypothetical protein
MSQLVRRDSEFPSCADHLRKWAAAKARQIRVQAKTHSLTWIAYLVMTGYLRSRVRMRVRVAFLEPVQKSRPAQGHGYPAVEGKYGLIYYFHTNTDIFYCI